MPRSVDARLRRASLGDGGEESCVDEAGLACEGANGFRFTGKPRSDSSAGLWNSPSREVALTADVGDATVSLAWLTLEDIESGGRSPCAGSGAGGGAPAAEFACPLSCMLTPLEA